MEADDLEGIAVITLIRSTFRKEEAARTGAAEQIAGQIPDLRPNYEADS